MGKRYKLLLGTALGLLLVTAPALGQWTGGQAYQSPYSTSTLLQSPSAHGDQLPQSYEAYWHNYLDRLQQEGGYYAITGNYPNSVPITSYYPATSDDYATQPGPGTGQPSMYGAYNQSDYSTYSSAQPPQQYQQQYGRQYQQPVQQQYPAQPQYQQPPTPVAESQASSKKRRISMKRQGEAATAQAPQSFEAQRGAWAQLRAMYQRPQQPYQQAYQQPQPYQQQGQAQAYQQYQQPGQAQTYQQYQQQPVEAQDVAYSSDPIVKEAQQKAYERAVARQRAAELAAHQQSALQELQQTQQMYEMAQRKLQEQEQRQRSLQEEYHRKSVSDAYEGLRRAQQKYYELMGVSGESGQAGQPQQQASIQGPQYQQPVQQYPQQGQQYPQQMQQYPQQGQQYPQQMQQYPQQAPSFGPGTPQQMPQVQGYVSGAPSPSYPGAPPGQAVPLHIQGQQPQSAGGGFWAALKEFLAPSTTIVKPTQSFDNDMTR